MGAEGRSLEEQIEAVNHAVFNEFGLSGNVQVHGLYDIYIIMVYMIYIIMVYYTNPRVSLLLSGNACRITTPLATRSCM